METNQRLIAEFDKNSAEKMKIHLQEWKAQTYLDLRVWTSEKAGQEGAERPTHRGITLNVELLGELKKAIDAAISALENGPEVEVIQDEAGAEKESPR